MDPGQHSQLHQYAYAGAAAGVSSINTTGGGDRVSQWSIQETLDFLMVRAELDPSFMETKRNKLLWEMISARMKEYGYSRSPEQCKCKWKNLVTRYKGCETMEAEGMRQHFPFYNEMQTIFTARAQRMMWLEAEGGGAASSSKNKGLAHFYSGEDDDNQECESDGEKGVAKKKRKVEGRNYTKDSSTGGNVSTIVNGIREIMEGFMKQQMQMEMQWLKAYEEREDERRVKEMEWRQRMEAMENERIMMDRRWREREEQRKVREEARAEKRDALINALLFKLRREGN